MRHLAALLTLLLLAACESKPIAPRADAVDPYPAVTVEKSIGRSIVVDYDLIVFDPLQENRPAAVQVPVRSTAKYPINVQYQFTWYDEKGRRVRDSGWKFQNMPTGLQRMFSSNAIDDRSSQWRLEIRSAR